MDGDLLDSVLNMLLQGAKDDQIVQSLMESGLSSEQAAQVLAEAHKTLPVARFRIIAREQEAGRVESCIAGSGMCDLCKKTLAREDHAPRQIVWRQIVSQSTSVDASTLLTIFVGRVSTTTTTHYRDLSGTYFLCRGCRSHLRPGWMMAILRMLMVTAVLALAGFVLGWLMSEPSVGAVILGVLGAIFGMFWGFTSRFRGFPCDQGFNLHGTDWDAEWQFWLVTGFLGLLAPVLGWLWFSNSQIPPPPKPDSNLVQRARPIRPLPANPQHR